MKTVIEFLDDLARNNDRDWFEAHRDRYVEAKRRFDEFAERYLAAVATFDPSVAGLALKDATYRIYRDTRFSADKSPYKTYMGVFACPRGKSRAMRGTICISSLRRIPISSVRASIPSPRAFCAAYARRS